MANEIFNLEIRDSPAINLRQVRTLKVYT